MFAFDFLLFTILGDEERGVSQLNVHLSPLYSLLVSFCFRFLA